MDDIESFHEGLNQPGKAQLKGKMKTLQEYGESLAKVTGGKLVFACPNYATVEAPGSMGIIFKIELPGPTQPNWRRQCAKIVRAYRNDCL